MNVRPDRTIAGRPKSSAVVNVAVDLLPGVLSGFDRWQRETTTALALAQQSGELGELQAFSFGKRYSRPLWLPSEFRHVRSHLHGRVQTAMSNILRCSTERILGLHRADVVLEMVLRPLRASAPVLLAVADVSWRYFGGQYRTTFTPTQIMAAERAISQAERILTISESSAADLRRGGVADDRISVVPLGVAEEFLQVPAEQGDQARKKYGLEPGYVLYVGGVNERKNVGALVEAIGLLQPGVRLVIAGVPPDEGLEFWNMERPWVRHLGYVPNDDLPGLYQAAAVFVFPSKLEGFGLPLVEAGAVGIPVLAADTPIFREMGGTAAVYFNADRPDELAAVLSSVLSDPEARQNRGTAMKERASHFTRTKFRRLLVEALAKTAQCGIGNRNVG